VELETVRITPQSLRDALVTAVAHFEYPLPNAGSVSIAHIADLASRNGIKVLLAGEGSDELFGGYERRLGRHFRPVLSRPLRVRRVVHRVHPDRARVALGNASARLRRPAARAGPSLPRADETLRFLDETAARAASAYRHHAGRRGRAEASLLSDMSHSPLPFLLNRMDKNGMQRSVEVRVPFLDPEVVELTVNLPLEARVGPVPKGVLRDVAERRLPRALARRPKHAGLAMDPRSTIARWAREDFLADGHMRDLLELPAEHWRRLVRSRDRRHLLHLWTGEIWCRLMLGGSTIGQVEAELWREAS
jgi:asparagine synthase (glutamine-hydrolysing)